MGQVLNRNNAIATPDLDQVIHKMDNFIAQFSKHDDPRERFLVMYRTFKIQLRKSLQRGRFLDSEWSEAICCRMGEMYFEAYEQYESNSDLCPQAWKLCFDASINHTTNLLQDALLGMNAHINYDLTICTYDIMDRFHDLGQGSDNPVDRKLNQLLRKRYFDYLLINQIAWESIPKIQDVLTKRFSKVLGVLNVLSFRFSRPIVQKIIMDHRDRAWTHALLMASSRNPVEVEHVKKFIDTLAVRNVYLIQKKLSFNPLDLVQETLQPTPIDFSPEDEQLDPEVGNLLIQRLQSRHTSEYATRALIQFGRNAIPLLVHTLNGETISGDLTLKIIRILREIGTAESGAILLEKIDHPNEKCRNSILESLSKMTADGVALQVNKSYLQIILQNEINHFYRISSTIDDVQKLAQSNYIAESLDTRRNRILCRIFNLLTVITGESSFNISASEVEHYFKSDSEDLPRLSAPRGIDEKINTLLAPVLNKNMAEIIRIARKRLGIPSVPAVQHLQEFVNNNTDPWLQECAAYYLNRHANSTEATTEEMNLKPELLQQEGNQEENMISTIEKVLHLKNVELFCEIPAEDLTGVAKIAHEKHFRDGEYLISQGTIGKNLLVIVNGKVNVIKDDGIPLAELGISDVLGEMSIISDSPTSANCIAAGPVEVLEINQQDFRDLLYGDYPEISQGLLKVLSDRLQITDQKVS